MKIAVIQYVHGNQKYFKYSVCINQYYCRLYGYDYVLFEEPPRPDRHVNWHKIEVTARFMTNCEHDYVLFLDADAHFYAMSLTIENELLPLLTEDGTEKDLLFAIDILKESARYSPATPNSGVILMRVNEFTRNFYEEWDASSQFHDLWKTELPHLADQAALVHVLYPKYQKHFALTKEYYLMNAVFGFYIRHYAGTNDEYRFTHMREFLKEYLPELYRTFCVQRTCENMNEELPFLSVCCPTYKRPELLAEFYDCFLKQDYPIDRRELIILDDAGQFLPFEDKKNGGKLVSPESEFYNPSILDFRFQIPNEGL